MKKYVALDDLWKCETCFHYRNGECAPKVWCENGESYRPAYDKLTIHTFDEKTVRCQNCAFSGYRFSGKNLWCDIFDKIMPEEGYCCFGDNKQ